VFRLFLYFLALFCLAQSANIVRLVQAPIEILGFWRLLVSALILLPLAIFKGNLMAGYRHNPRLFFYSLLSGFFFFLHLWTFFYSAHHTSIAHCMIIYSVNPLFTAVGAWLFFREAVSWRLLAAYVLAFLGIYQLMGSQFSLLSIQGGGSGDWSALASAVFFVGYLLFGKKIRQSVANTSYSVVIYLTASLFFGATALLQNYQFTDYPTTTWLAIGASILLPTLLGHALFTYLMKFMNINLMTCGKLIEPAISSITAYFLFAESLNDNTVVAFFLMSTAIIILFYPVIRQSLLDR
jgi:drug/metabolite transporter (DMT)-like permease